MDYQSVMFKYQILSISEGFLYPVRKLLVPDDILVWTIKVPKLIVLSIFVPQNDLSKVSHRGIQDPSRLVTMDCEVVHDEST